MTTTTTTTTTRQRQRQRKQQRRHNEPMTDVLVSFRARELAPARTLATGSLAVARLMINAAARRRAAGASNQQISMLLARPVRPLPRWIRRRSVGPALGKCVLCFPRPPGPSARPRDVHLSYISGVTPLWAPGSSPGGYLAARQTEAMTATAKTKTRTALVEINTEGRDHSWTSATQQDSTDYWRHD